MAKQVTYVETITPAKAMEMIKLNTRNRPKKLGKIAEYSAAMREGRWALNGETIKVAHNDVLIDGQNRLYGCVEAGVPFETYVIRGLDPDMFDTIDIGAKRTSGDSLHADGCTYATTVAAAIKWLPVIRGEQAGGHSGADLTPDQVRLVWAADNGEIEKSAGFVGNGAKIRGLLPPGLACALHYVFKAKSRGHADEFFRLLAAGTDLSAGHPILVLRERLLSGRVGKARLHQTEQAAITIRAWNSYRAQTKVKVLVGSRAGSNGKAQMPAIA